MIGEPEKNPQFAFPSELLSFFHQQDDDDDVETISSMKRNQQNNSSSFFYCSSEFASNQTLNNMARIEM